MLTVSVLLDNPACMEMLYSYAVNKPNKDINSISVEDNIELDSLKETDYDLKKITSADKDTFLNFIQIFEAFEDCKLESDTNLCTQLIFKLLEFNNNFKG